MRPAWVRRSIEHVIRQFCDNPAYCWIGAATLQGMNGTNEGGLARRGGRYETLPDIDIHLSEGFLWRPDKGSDPPELWLAPTKTGYRSAYERFAKRYLGAAGLNGADVQIDHMFPKKAAALGGLGYVRMLAVPPASNMAAGRTLERAMVARNEDFGPRTKPTRLATYFTIGKATGFIGYEQMPDDEKSRPNAQLSGALMAHLRREGLPADLLAEMDEDLTAGTASILR